jgi:hypothetical protein
MSRYKHPRDSTEVDYRGVKITKEGAERFFDEVTHAPECSECGENKWRMLLSPGDDTRLCLPTVGPGHTGRFVSITMLSCDRCGFIKLHTLRPIAAWLRDNGEDDELEE